MNWIYERQWYWIEAQDPRLNNRGTVSEWLTLPLVLFFKWDHLVFLPNWISFLFFPGLIFRTWRSCGVSSKVAWVWMWLLPSAFCYSLQASDAANDILATFYALAAFDFLRRRRSVPPLDISASLLSAALMVGTKLTMAPMLLPWAIIFLPHLRAFLKHPLLASVTAVWAASISFLPNGFFNYLHYRSISGLSQEPYILTKATHLELFVGNMVLLVAHNFIFPGLAHFSSVTSRLCNSSLGRMIQKHFEADATWVPSSCSVEQSGLGFIVLLAGAVIFVVLIPPCPIRRWIEGIRKPEANPLLHLIVWLFVFAFMLISTAAQPARLISGYYPFAVCTLFVGQAAVSCAKRRFIRNVSAIGIVAVMLCVGFITDPPLIPVHARFSERHKFESHQTVYLNASLPPNEIAIGMFRKWNQPESWAWQPYGQRRVYELSNDPTREQLTSRGIHYAVVTQVFLKEKSETIENWLVAHHARLVGSCLSNEAVPLGCYLVHFN